MTNLFLMFLQMSLMAAGVTVIALPLRWLFRRLRLPALACVLLWLVVALRMVLPVGMVTSSFSLMGWLTPAVEERVDALARMAPAAEAPPTTAAPAYEGAHSEADPVTHTAVTRADLEAFADSIDFAGLDLIAMAGQQ